MKTHDRYDLEVRAAAALKSALAEVSTIKVREIRHESFRSGCGLTADIDILGRRHSLACAVHDGHPQDLSSALYEWSKSPAFRADVLPVVIAPHLSPETQAVCKENHAGYIDLDGNARLALGEIFIVKRTLPHTQANHPTKPVLHEKTEWKRPPQRASQSQKSATPPQMAVC